MTQHPITLLLGLSLLLSACGGQSSTTTPDSTGVAPLPTTFTTLNGKLVNWPGTTAMLASKDFFTTPATLLAQTTVSNDGSFSLTLPSEATMTSHLNKLDLTPSTGCTSTITSSDPETKVFSTKGFEVSMAGQATGSAGLGYSPTAFRPGKKGDLAVRWFYADRPMTLQGTSSCSGTNTYIESYDLHFSKGWNAATYEYMADTSTSGGHNYKIYSGVNAKAFWGYIPSSTTVQ